MRVSWLLFVPLVLAITPEYTQVLHLVSTAVREQAPLGNPLYWSCPQGPPGVQGMRGVPGKNDLETDQDIQEWQHYVSQNLPPPPLMCNVDAAAHNIIQKLLQLPRYNNSYPRGPPGPLGHTGLLASQALLRRVQEHCYHTNAIVPMCDFENEIFNSFVSYLSIPLYCPDRLQGGMGPRGTQGADTLQNLDISGLAERLCPKEL